MDAAEANEVDVADDIKAIEVKPKALMKAAARAALKECNHRHVLRRSLEVRQANAVQDALPQVAGDGGLALTQGV